MDKGGVPHAGFQDAILPKWADALFPQGALASVTGVLRVLPPGLKTVDEEDICYNGRWPTLKSARRRRRY